MAKKRITKEDIDGIEKSAVREERKEQGAFDGRFRSKVIPSKKKYKRRKKNDEE